MRMLSYNYSPLSKHRAKLITAVEVQEKLDHFTGDYYYMSPDGEDMIEIGINTNSYEANKNIGDFTSPMEEFLSRFEFNGELINLSTLRG